MLRADREGGKALDASCSVNLALINFHRLFNVVGLQDLPECKPYLSPWLPSLFLRAVTLQRSAEISYAQRTAGA